MSAVEEKQASWQMFRMGCEPSAVIMPEAINRRGIQSQYGEHILGHHQHNFASARLSLHLNMPDS